MTFRRTAVSVEPFSWVQLLDRIAATFGILVLELRSILKLKARVNLGASSCILEQYLGISNLFSLVIVLIVWLHTASSSEALRTALKMSAPSFSEVPGLVI